MISYFKVFFIRLRGRFRKIKDPRHATGDWGEGIALSYLRREKGYRLLDKNWRGKRGELDIVMLDDQVVVVVEVRTRHRDSLVSAYDSIRYKKRKALRRTIQEWVNGQQPKPRTLRCDVIGIEFNTKENFDLYHYQNVGLMGKDWIP